MAGELLRGIVCFVSLIAVIFGLAKALQYCARLLANRFPSIKKWPVPPAVVLLAILSFIGAVIVDVQMYEVWSVWKLILIPVATPFAIFVLTTLTAVRYGRFYDAHSQSPTDSWFSKMLLWFKCGIEYSYMLYMGGILLFFIGMVVGMPAIVLARAVGFHFPFLYIAGYVAACLFSIAVIVLGGLRKRASIIISGCVLWLAILVIGGIATDYSVGYYKKWEVPGSVE